MPEYITDDTKLIEKILTKETLMKKILMKKIKYKIFLQFFFSI